MDWTRTQSRWEETWSGEIDFVQFNSYKGKLDILRNCKKLKGTNFSVFEDFSKKTASIRKEKWKEVLKIRKDGKIFYLQYKTVICKERTQVS